MKTANARVVLTGAAGGLGQQIATELCHRGAVLGLIDLNPTSLSALESELNKISQHTVYAVAADLTDDTARQQAVDEITQKLGDIDILINCAGLNAFTAFTKQDSKFISKMMAVNTLAPMLLTHSIVPGMLKKGRGQIVNIGSTFGSIGFAWFSTYSASKFALRGFSEALRRELKGTGVNVSYIAPRAVRTAMNTDAMYDNASAIKMKFDEPDIIARKIVDAIENNVKDAYIGFPESFFVRLNSILPRLVDKALHKQNIEMGKYVE